MTYIVIITIVIILILLLLIIITPHYEELYLCNCHLSFLYCFHRNDQFYQNNLFRMKTFLFYLNTMAKLAYIFSLFDIIFHFRVLLIFCSQRYFLIFTAIYVVVFRNIYQQVRFSLTLLYWTRKSNSRFNEGI